MNAQTNRRRELQWENKQGGDKMEEEKIEEERRKERRERNLRNTRVELRAFCSDSKF